jgi:hypothetical protein
MSEFDPNDPNSVEQHGDGGAGQEGGGAGGDEFDPNFVGDGPKARNNGFLVLMALVVLGGGGVYLMKMRAVPSSAQASAEVTKANETIDRYLNDGGKNLSSMKDMLKGTEKVVQMFMNYSNVPQVKLDDLKNNPFQAEAAKESDPNAEATKAAKAREEEKRKLLEDAQKLKLQSVLANVRVPTCMINGKTYAIGNEIELGFTIESMEPGSVTIKRGNFKVALTMSSGNLNK